MSKIADTEANATSLDGLVNDNALITTLRNGPKPSWQYIVDQVYAQLGYAVAGSFVTGFTYTGIRQVGVDASGNTWIYTGGQQNIPHTVPSGTVPSTPDYFQVSVNSADNVVLDNGENLQQAIDRLNDEIDDISTADGIINDNGGTVQEFINSSIISLSLSEVVAGASSVGRRFYITDLNNARYDVVDISDAGGYYIAIDASTKLKLVENKNLSYDSFNIDTSGSTQEDANLTAAHSYAVSSGVSINQSSGSVLISGDNQIDLLGVGELSGGFKYVIDGEATANPVFVVGAEYTTITLDESDITIGEFYKGATRISSLSSYSNKTLVILSNDADITRSSGGVQLKRYATKIGQRNGDLMYPLVFDFPSVTELRVTPSDADRVTIKGFAVEYSGVAKISNMLICQRNNVTMTNPKFINSSGASVAVDNFIGTSFVSGFVVDTPTGDYLGDDRVANSYLVNFWTSCDMQVINPQHINGWAQLDGNYVRDVKVIGGVIDRAGGHFSCWDYYFENNHFVNSNAVKISGGGILSIKNPTFTVNPEFDEYVCVNIREDYAAEWQGSIHVDSYLLDLTGVTSEIPLNTRVTVFSSLIGSAVGSHNFGRTTYLPSKITVSNGATHLSPDLSNTIAIRECVVGVFASGLFSGVEYPRNIDVRDCSIFGDAYARKYKHVAVDFLGSLKPNATKVKSIININGINNKDPRSYGENPSQTSEIHTLNIYTNNNLYVEANVENCDWFTSYANSASAEVINVNVNSSRVSGIDGNSKALYSFGQSCKYPATYFNGSWKGVFNGGTIEVYRLANDSGYGIFGFPNYVELNGTYFKNMVINTDGVILAENTIYSNAVIDYINVQTGYVSPSYHFAPI